MSAIVSARAIPSEQRTEHPQITRIQGVQGGIPIVRGTRIPVRLIAQMYRAGDSVDDILKTYPHLGATSVHDAISYYLDHRAEIEQEIIEHRVENILAQNAARADERGSIIFNQAPKDA
ncbi:MAG: DUF433 domain-containing protein [Chloroflexi bacterium]|nr:DUF433 domain-containing protein [Chloroflexota bacterium]